jgi:hypothetical protein
MLPLVSRKAVWGLAWLALIAAGCGGGSTTIYDAERTSACIAKEATVDEKDSDFVSARASGGTYSATVGGTRVVLGFFGTVGDAKKAESAYKSAAAAFPAPIGDVLFRKGNVTMAWDEKPTSSQKSVVVDCLREKGA